MRQRKWGLRFALIALLVLLFAGCSAREKRDGARETAVFTASDEAAALCVDAPPREKLRRVASAGMTTLYLDEATCSVSVYDASSKTLWRALPEESKTSFPAALRLHVLADQTDFILNAQTDSVAEGRAKITELEGGVQVTYGFEKHLPSGKLLQFAVPVSYCLEEGLLRVQVDLDLLRGEDCDRRAAATSLELLPYFGAAQTAEAGDSLFLPDGCGAVFDLASPALRKETIELPVYEPDGASVAAFGMKRGEGAFAALVEEGEANAVIRAEFNTEAGDLARVGAAFTLTPTETGKNGRVWTAKRETGGKISVSYRFLSGSSANISGMAAACRELLIRGGVLDFAAADPDETANEVHLHLLGSASFSQPGKGSLAFDHTLTNFARAQDLLTFLRGKGITNPAVFYFGMFSGGLVPRDDLNLSLRMRGAVSAKDFASFAANSDIPVYPMATLRARSGKAGGAQTLAGDPIRFSLDYTGSRISAAGSGKALAAKKTKKADDMLLREARKLPFSGFGFADAGTLLYADASGAVYADRAACKAGIVSALEAFSASKKLAVCGGNVYALKYASAVLDLPNTAKTIGEDCKAVPFLQMLLHGAVSYSGKPLNLCEDSAAALLKAAEYGEVPALALYAADYGSDEAPDTLNDLQNAALLQTLASQMIKTFADLAFQRITLHEEVQSGVFCTHFGTNARVYVNYNETDAVQSGVTIPARSFLRVN